MARERRLRPSQKVVVHQAPERSDNEDERWADIIINGVAPATTVTTATPVTPNHTNVVKKERYKMALTPDQIAALLAGSRTKGQYLTRLAEFIESGENGVCANDEWFEFEDKKSATLKQGFDNAIQNKQAPEGADKVKVIVNEEKVYLVNLAAAGVSMPDDETEAAA